LHIEKVEREVRARKLELEQLISRGIQDTVATHAAIVARRKNYLGQLETAARELRQAEVNYKAS
jgi:hypothetical protein